MDDSEITYSDDGLLAQCPTCGAWVELADIRLIIQDMHGITPEHAESLELWECLVVRCDG